MVLFIGCVIFLAIFILVYFGANQAAVVSNAYEKAFTDSARKEMGEMFIFIDPKRIFTINIISIFIAFLLGWLFSGSFVIGIIVGLVLGNTPRFLWKFLKTRRTDRFVSELPDALTSVSSMMKAGSNLSVAMETLVAESKGPIAQEFGLFLRELKMGVDSNQALDNIETRMPIPEVELFIAAMKISREIGGSLADVLYRLADTLRRKIEMEGKIKALTAQGKAQGWVMSLLPVVLALILYQMEPDAMSKLFEIPIGWAVCAVFCVMMYMGYFFIKKIVSIDV